MVLNVVIASSLAARKYWSLVVNEELSTKTTFEAVSQMAILGPSKWILEYCSHYEAKVGNVQIFKNREKW